MRRALVPSLLVVLLAAGCGGTGSSATPTPTPTPTPAPTPSASSSETPTPTPSPSASATPSASPTTAADIATLLLPAADLPGYTGSWSWSEGDTTTSAQVVGPCARFAVETMGAERSVTRRYLPTGDETGGTATHQVATFVDDKSVRQARAILTTWRDQCAKRLAGTGEVEVGPVTTIITPAGNGSWYLVTTHKPGAARSRFQMLGLLTSGTTVELIEMDRTARTFGYTPRNEPVVGAVDAAAERLAG